MRQLGLFCVILVVVLTLEGTRLSGATPIGTSSSTTESEWLTYHDPVWNIVLSYPAAWSLQLIPYQGFGLRVSSPDVQTDDLGNLVSGAYFWIDVASANDETISYSGLGYSRQSNQSAEEGANSSSPLQGFDSAELSNDDTLTLEKSWTAWGYQYEARFVQAQADSITEPIADIVLSKLRLVGEPASYPALPVDITALTESLKIPFPRSTGTIPSGGGYNNADRHRRYDKYALDFCQFGVPCERAGRYAIAPTAIVYKHTASNQPDYHFFEVLADTSSQFKLCLSLAHFDFGRDPEVGDTFPRGAVLGALSNYNPPHTHVGIWATTPTRSCVGLADGDYTSIPFLDFTSSSPTGDFRLEQKSYPECENGSCTNVHAGDSVSSSNDPFCFEPSSLLNLRMPKATFSIVDIDPGDCFGSCPAPTLVTPANNAVLESGENIHFSWNPITNCGSNGYMFRVCTWSNVADNRECFIDHAASLTSNTETISGHDDQDLWWGVSPANVSPEDENWTAFKFRIEPREPTSPDLRPFTPTGWQYPVVPNSSAQPTQATTTLYAGGYPSRDVMTFFDWAFTNSGSGTANGDFHVEVRIDDNWFIRYPYRDVGPGGGANWENWMHPVLTPGQHVLKIVVDPDNRIAESNENNNEWQHTFNWQPISGWYAEYYSNESLTWPPEMVRDDAEINFSWPGSPAPNIPADGFSVRWARTDNFSAGTYRFSGYQDDGARVQIDGTTYYEKWTDPTVSSFTFDKALTPGQHTVMFEMYEHSGGAEAELSWELLAPTVPGIPSHISPSNNAVFNRNDNITLTWSTSSNASRYMAQIIADPDFVRESGWTSGTSWNVGQLSGGLYAWRIRAESSAGFSSDWSSTRLFTVKYGRPTSLTATAASSSQINLSWSASGDAPNNLDGYRIYRDGSAIATVSSAATTYANTGLSCETGYTYVVRAYKGSVESDASNSASATTTSCSLAAPDVNPIYNPDSDGTFRIVWSAFPGATWYVAEQRRGNGVWEPSYSGDGEWYEVTDYSVGEWCFRVQAITATATSPWSTIVCTQVGDIAEPPGIPILSAISNPDQANSYWVSWTNVSGAAEYELQGQWNLGAWSNVYSGSSVSYYASGQTEGTWCYRVQARNSVGTSGWSDMACTSVRRLTYPYNVYIVSIMK